LLSRALLGPSAFVNDLMAHVKIHCWALLILLGFEISLLGVNKQNLNIYKPFMHALSMQQKKPALFQRTLPSKKKISKDSDLVL
jgi:hypothetical protein